MMPRNWGGMVDEQWKVHGVKDLTVSIMPDLPGAYTQQTVYAMANKGGGFDQAEGLIKGVGLEPLQPQTR
jgi:choline dehydrogenase